MQGNHGLSRRSLVMLLALGSVTAATGYGVYTWAPWLDYEQQIADARIPFQRSAAVPQDMRELVRMASLAANGHNTQPWRFMIAGNAIEMRPDFTRRLAVVDPRDREMWISLGCALENLLVAARASGFAPHVTYPDKAKSIRIELAAVTPQPSPLATAITRRQNTRSEYDGRPLSSADLGELRAVPAEPGVTLHFLTGSSAMETVVDYVTQGTLKQYADKAFLAELTRWLRFNKQEALESLDGLYTGTSGNPEVPRWLGEMFLASTKPQPLADADAKKLRSSAGAVLIASATEDRSAWVRAGQVYERLALTMTSLGVRSAMLNQPMEVKGVRLRLASAMGLGGAQPQLLARFGHAKEMPWSSRRPVVEVIDA
jgi:hypothetical protein